MWDNAKLLNGIASGLYAVAGLIAALLGALAVATAAALPFRTVAVTGALTRILPEELSATLDARVAGNFFSADLERVRAALVELPWVREAEVRRRWPDRLEVRIEEHRPLARWGESQLINTYGELFNGRTGDELPLFAGPAGTHKEVFAQYATFRELVAPLGGELQQVALSPRRAWQITIALPSRTTLVVDLGREQPRAAVNERLVRFVAAYPQTLARLRATSSARTDHVDLRYANGFALRVPGFGARAAAPSSQRPRRTPENARPA